MPIDTTEAVRMLQGCSDRILDAAMQPYVAKWSSPPKAIELLEVVDHCIHGSLSSGLVLTLLQTMYREALAREGLTHEQLVPLATWRNEGQSLVDDPWREWNR